MASLKADRVALDTSVYITALRRPVDLSSLAGGRQLWMRDLESLFRHQKPGRARPRIRARFGMFSDPQTEPRPKGVVWVPSQEEIGRGRLTNDTLIAVSSARIAATVITLNASGFRRLAEFHPFQWETAKL